VSLSSLGWNRCPVPHSVSALLGPAMKGGTHVVKNEPL